MGKHTLQDRIDQYAATSDYTLLSRLPLILTINGKSFQKFTSLIEKPEDHRLSQCFQSTATKLCAEIEGATFAFQYNDEIVLLLKNDQGPDTFPWLNNKIQDLVSVSSSIATNHFKDCLTKVGANVSGVPIFRSFIFSVPNLIEAANVFVSKQQSAFFLSVQFACLYELLNKGYNKEEVKDMISGLSTDAKIDLLEQECGIDFGSYSSGFRKGVGFYKAPRLVEGGLIKDRWVMNEDLPIFTQNQDFLKEIIKNGRDIFRA